jgi:hypothetical protein
MFDNFTSSLESSNVEESEQNQAYKALIRTKQEELATLENNLLQKEDTHAENGRSLADDNENRANTQELLATTEAFFKETKKNCRRGADDWAERSRLRTEELGGINKAIDILSNEDLFSKSYDNFLQLSVDPFVALSKVAKEHHSLRLAALAVKARGGHFDEVIVMVDKMLAHVRQEDQDDIDMKDTCERKRAELTSEASDLSRGKKNAQTKLDLLQEEERALDKAKAQVQREIETTEQEMKDALENRSQEKNEFEEELTDDREAARLVGKAIEALAAFYSNNKLELGLAQKPEDSPYTIDQDKAPETGFSKPYKGRSSESGGIVAILKMIKEDLENEMKESQKAEAGAQKEYKETLKAASNSLQAGKDRRLSLQKQLAENDTNQANTANDIKNLKDENTANDGTFSAHCDECQWIYNLDTKPKECKNAQVAEKSSFTTRKEHRAAELQGLQDARAALAGASKQ